MDPKILAIVGMRAAALALAFAGQSKASDSLYALADAAEAGVNIDAHMSEVAAKLKSRSVTDDDWNNVAAKIQADSDRLQGTAPHDGGL